MLSAVLLYVVVAPAIAASHLEEFVAPRAREGAGVVARGLRPEGAPERSRLVGFPVGVQPEQTLHLMRRGRPLLLVSGDQYRYILVAATCETR